MAGSYRHCEKKGEELPNGEYGPTGEFDAEFFHDMIENGGDAYEACHMMFWMIQYLADNAWTIREDAIKAAEEAYYEVARGERENPYWDGNSSFA